MYLVAHDPLYQTLYQTDVVQSCNINQRVLHESLTICDDQYLGSVLMRNGPI